MQQHPTLGSILTNPAQFSCRHAAESHPRLNFYKPCSVQLFQCSNTPPSAQSLQTLFRPVVPMQPHPTRGSMFTNPVQFSCSHAATSHPRLNFCKPCSAQLLPRNNIPPSAQILQTLFSSVVPTQQHPTLGSIFTNPVQFSCSHATTSHYRLDLPSSEMNVVGTS